MKRAADGSFTFVVVAAVIFVLLLLYLQGTVANAEGSAASAIDVGLYNSGLSGLPLANPINNFLAWLNVLFSPGTLANSFGNLPGVAASLAPAIPTDITPYFGSSVGSYLNGMSTVGVDQTNMENANPNG